MSRKRRSRNVRWTLSPIEQLCDDELAVIVEHHGFWSKPSSRWTWRRH